MSEADPSRDGSDRFAKAVRRALKFVGPAEGGRDWVSAERPTAPPVPSVGQARAVER